MSLPTVSDFLHGLEKPERRRNAAESESKGSFPGSPGDGKKREPKKEVRLMSGMQSV